MHQVTDDKRKYAQFKYGLQTRTVITVTRNNSGHHSVMLDTGISYMSECFKNSYCNDVYLVRIDEGAAFGSIVEGIKISDEKGDS